MLHAKFTQAENDELEAQPRFRLAMKAAHTHESFERLCEAGEEILKAHKLAHPAARQFRQGTKYPCSSAIRVAGLSERFGDSSIAI